MDIYGVIMAGGGGTRFWPLSRKETPKQLLNLSGKELMINETIDRISPMIDRDNLFIVTNTTQADKMRAAVQNRMKAEHILREPSARNTAACIGYAAVEIVKKHGDGMMCIFPADHHISNQQEFLRILQEAVRTAEEKDCLVTVGIEPTFPSTGYGYIQYDRGGKSIARPVKEFVEKPDLETARAYLADGSYVWNSGMFIWKASTILERFKALLPDIYHCLTEIGDAMGTEREAEVINRIYPVIPKISIDYGIMERAQDVWVIPGDFGWNDVGSWDTLGVLYEADEHGNVIHGHQINIDTTNCISYAGKKLVATIGVDNLIVVETEDAVLVCAKERAQDVKKVVDILNERNEQQYL